MRLFDFERINNHLLADGEIVEYCHRTTTAIVCCNDIASIRQSSARIIVRLNPVYTLFASHIKVVSYREVISDVCITTNRKVFICNQILTLDISIS